MTTMTHDQNATRLSLFGTWLKEGGKGLRSPWTRDSVLLPRRDGTSENDLTKRKCGELVIVAKRREKMRKGHVKYAEARRKAHGGKRGSADVIAEPSTNV